MARRYVYDRIDHRELSRRLGHLGLTARGLARASGAGETRVMDWLSGEGDIPPHIDLLTKLWIEVPGVADTIEEWVSVTCRDNRQV